MLASEWICYGTLDCAAYLRRGAFQALTVVVLVSRPGELLVISLNWTNSVEED
jgi:hypothetical protein